VPSKGKEILQRRYLDVSEGETLALLGAGTAHGKRHRCSLAIIGQFLPISVTSGSVFP